jgi:hypothetical protein
MQLTLLKGYPDFVGKRATFVGYGNGPASYSQTTGDPVAVPLPNWYIDAIDGTPNSASGTYFVRAQPAGVGARQAWKLIWYLTASGAQVSNAVNLSAEQIQIGGKCGQY